MMDATALRGFHNVLKMHPFKPDIYTCTSRALAMEATARETFKNFSYNFTGSSLWLFYNIGMLCMQELFFGGRVDYL